MRLPVPLLFCQNASCLVNAGTTDDSKVEGEPQGVLLLQLIRSSGILVGWYHITSATS